MSVVARRKGFAWPGFACTSRCRERAASFTAQGAVQPFGFSTEAGVLAAGLTWVGGMLPDLDSDSGVPVREMFGLAAAVLPLLLMHRLIHMGLSREAILAVLLFGYIFVKYGAANIFKHFNVHRGMYHSLPAMLIAGLVVYLAYDSPDRSVRLLLARRRDGRVPVASGARRDLLGRLSPAQDQVEVVGGQCGQVHVEFDDRHSHLLPDPRQPRLSGLPGLQEADDDRDSGEQADGNASLSHRESGPFWSHTRSNSRDSDANAPNSHDLDQNALQTDRV